MYIGYSANKAQALLEDIAEKYNNLDNYVQSDFDILINCLRNNWIGSDENSFEANLSSRLHTLRLNSYQLCYNAIDLINRLYESWQNFQNTNSLGPIALSYNRGLVVPILNQNIQSLIKSANHYHDSENFGLTSEASASIIKKAFESFVQNVKTKVSSLADSIKSNNAFFGEQSKALNNYIELLSNSLADLLTAVKEMYNQLDTLVVKNYQTHQTRTIESFNVNAERMSDKVSELASGANNRWS